MGRKRTDAIRDFLEGELHFAELREPEREYLEQLKLVEAMWSNGKPDVVVRTALCEQFDITDNTARQSLRDCSLVFGDLKEVNRKMMRYRASQMSLKAYDMAEAQSDYKGMIAATKGFVEANGINNEDPDLPDFEKFTGGAILMALPPGMEKLVELMAVQGGVIDHTELPEGWTPMPDLEPEPLTIETDYDELEP